MDAVIHKQRRITDGHPISFGSKDGHRESRVDKLEYITGKYVILWDEDDKRGWMMNGATALLHILRASLERNRTGKFRSKCSFKPEQMQEAETRYESDSALEVLLNHENQSLSIFEGEDFTVKDRIEDFVYILDQMTEYEETRLIKKSRAIGPKNQASERLEGWDFIDVATRKYPVCPRSGVLQTIGRSWTELTRSLNAITIFGRGFGDLIQPVDSCNLCSHWDRLPKNRYYLAALIPDVMQIFKDVQPRLTSPRMLFDDILWHHSDRTVDLCACLKDSSIKHFDIVDILKPHNTGQGSEGMYWIDSKESGAVLFGNCTESTTSPACQASQNQSCRQDIGLGVSGAQATIRSVDPIPSHSSLKKRQSLQAVEVHLPEPIAEANDILNNDSPKMSPPDQPKHYSEFQIAILCALKIESDAVQSFFDGHWDHHKQPQGDDNAYSTGWIGNHAVILVHLPGMGTLKASTAAKDLKRTCPHIKLGLVVGICGAVPFYGKDRKEILLGDVIVSTSLIQHDLGRQHETEFTRKRKRHEELSRSTDPIQAFLNKISTLVGHNRLSSRTTNYVVEPFRGPNASRFQYPQYPGVESDKLYETDYCHKHHNPADCRRGKCVVGEATETRFCKRASKRSCAKLGCDDRRLVPRQRLQEAKQYARQNIRLEHPTHTSSETWIHFGQIASGDAVIKSGRHRDERASAERKAGGREILGFEMEGAGVWESVPTIVVKGVCDYSDSHKNDVWHGYAASTAAACMKALLNEWPVFDRGSDDEPSKLIRY
jgi:nucleoside phosphorylase